MVDTNDPCKVQLQLLAIEFLVCCDVCTIVNTTIGRHSTILNRVRDYDSIVKCCIYR